MSLTLFAPNRGSKGMGGCVISGCVTVEAEGGLYVVPPSRAVWLPPEVRHAVWYPREVAFRGVMIRASRCESLPSRPTVIQVDPLTRELIRELTGYAWDYAPDGREARVVQVLLERLVDLPALPLSLPKGRDERVRRVTQALLEHPLDGRSLAAWAESIGMSERTLARRFRADTGMSFGVWRRQLLLVGALQRLAAGDPVSTVAFDLGYASVASFW